eukprot:TRINITY_DN32913_c0_g1_i1.p1 TRINITY_DN32913_c0_g1~~TRINITY_DN32913_c0_g1_i1.p1  ORF type:complete len:356 (+),score=140.80 TRINITY_DN32913_c0_g1_i1:66-1070(+)
MDAGAREFAGAVMSEKDRLARVPSTPPERHETAVKYIERANSIAVDLALKQVMFTPAVVENRMYIVAQIADELPKTWSWDLFADTLNALERAWQEWRSLCVRGAVWKEPKRWELRENAEKETVGTCLASQAVLLDGLKPHRMTDCYGNATGYARMLVKTPQAEDDAADYRWLAFDVYTGTVDVDFLRITPFKRDDEGRVEPYEWTTLPLGQKGYCYKVPLAAPPTALYLLEVCARDEGGRKKKKKSKVNPLAMEQLPNAPSATPRCVVCLRSGRQGEVRKSGYKCKECIGTPSGRKGCLEDAPRQGGYHGTHSSVREAEMYRVLATPQLPGAAS